MNEAPSFTKLQNYFFLKKLQNYSHNFNWNLRSGQGQENHAVISLIVRSGKFCTAHFVSPSCHCSWSENKCDVIFTKESKILQRNQNFYKGIKASWLETLPFDLIGQITLLSSFFVPRQEAVLLSINKLASYTTLKQSVTSRSRDFSVSRLFGLKTFRSRDFYQFFSILGIRIGKLGLLKNVLVSEFKQLVSEKKSQYWSRKIWSRKKSLGIGIRKIGVGKKSRYRYW